MLGLNLIFVLKLFKLDAVQVDVVAVDALAACKPAVSVVNANNNHNNNLLFINWHCWLLYCASAYTASHKL